MNLRPRRHEEPEINLAPLIDVVFLMLIFFMVSTTFIKVANLKVSLPPVNAAPSVRKDKPIEVTINRQGTYFIDGRVLPDNREETLRQALVKRLSGHNPQSVRLVIRADEHTEHLHVVTALDAAALVGVQHVAIAALASGQ